MEAVLNIRIETDQTEIEKMEKEKKKETEVKTAREIQCRNLTGTSTSRNIHAQSFKFIILCFAFVLIQQVLSILYFFFTSF